MTPIEPSRSLTTSKYAPRSALGAALLFGASTPLAKLAVSSASPVLIAGLLYLGSASDSPSCAQSTPPPAFGRQRLLLREKTCRGWQEPSSPVVSPGRFFC